MISAGFCRAAAVLLALAALAPAARLSAAEAVEGPCTASFNGIEAEQVASLSSPLLLRADETLTFSGTDNLGTLGARVEVLLGPVTLGSAASSPATAAGEFTVDLPLAAIAADGVGLLRVRAVTDHCRAEAWLRVGGRLPFTTTAGLMGTGLAVAGLAGLGAAFIAGRRWSPWVAAVAGFFAGAAGAMLAQQSGRLQLSYWSLAACALPAAAAGLGLALLLQHRRVGHEAATAGPEEPAGEPPDTRPAAVVAAPAPSPATRSAPVAELPPVKREGFPCWCYVLADVPVLHLDDYSRVVATLRPGTWYLAKREVSGWAQVEVEAGVEGWVPRRALHRQD